MTRATVSGYGGVPLSVIDRGDPDAPSILLIHGWSQSALCWTGQIDALSDRFRVVAPDLRGHGASGKPEGAEPYATAEPWAGDIAAVIDGLGLDHPVIVGWSMGGYVVQDYLAHFGGGAISGLCLVSCGVTKGSYLPQAARAARAADAEVTAAGMLSDDPAENIAATLGFLRSCTARPVDRDLFATMAAYNMACPTHARRASRTRAADYRRTTAALDLPIMVVWGDRDRSCHRSTFDELCTTLPRARVEVFEGAGHTPFIEDPSRFDPVLASFADTCHRAAYPVPGPMKVR